MKKIFLLLIPALLSNFLFAQDKEEAEKLVAEGVAYHDKEDYEGAIVRYDRALGLDKDNLLALTEKALTLMTIQKFEESIKCCQKAIKKHAGDNALKSIYVNYGSALDGLKKTDKSIEIYDEGIKLFPDYYLLHFNKGVTLASVQKYDAAIACFQQAIILNPDHASSHNAIARLLNYQKKRIPSLLAYCRYLVIDPETNRSRENLKALQQLIGGNVKKTGDNSITINLSPDMLGDTDAKAKPKENSFHSTDLILALSSGLDYDEKNKNKTDVEKFISKLETICASLAETRKDNYGFYWEYYVPYFIAMEDKKLLETFSYIAFASSGDAVVSDWLKSNDTKVSEFYEWNRSFAWNKALK